MTVPHAVLWIDQDEAKVFHLDRETFDATTIESHHRHARRHPDASVEHRHPVDAKHYFHEVARAVEDAAEILVVGPSTAKLHFVKHVHEQEHLLAPKIVGVETVDHPSDGQLVAYARKYFRAADRMR